MSKQTTKGAKKAPKTNKGSIPSKRPGPQEYDSAIVEKILSYDVREYLEGDVLAAYDAVTSLTADIEAERGDRTSGLDRASEEYIKVWNSIRSPEYSAAASLTNKYEAVAELVFCNVYRQADRIPDLEAAYRIGAERIVMHRRDMLAQRMRAAGKSIDDAPSIEADLKRAGIEYENITGLVPKGLREAAAESGDPVPDDPGPRTGIEYDVLWLMSDDALKEVFDSALSYISNALYEAYAERDPARDPMPALTSFLSVVGTDVLDRKWTCGAEPPAAERITTFRADNYVTSTHKTMATHSKGILLHKNVINQKRFKVDVGGNVTSTMSVVCNHDGVANMFLDGHITRYQALVADAVFTLLTVAEELNLPPRMTAQMIFAAMPGKSADPNSEQCEAIAAALLALRHLEVFYDGAKEFARKGISAPPLNDTFFAYRIMPGIDQRGKAVEFYDFEGRTPILLDIARKTGQVLTIPSEYIKVPGRLDSDKRFTVRCLAQRVGHINNKNTNRQLTEPLARIKLATLYEETGHGGATGAAATRLRTFFQKTLDHFVACGWIDGYKIIDTKGRAIEVSAHGRTPDYYQIIPRGGGRMRGKKRAKK